MSNLEQNNLSQPPADPHLRGHLLKEYVDNEMIRYAERQNPDRPSSEKLDEKVEVTKRTALLMAAFVHEFIGHLEKENEQIKKILETSTDGAGVNLSNLREKLKKNEDRVQTLTENCLNPLDPIVDETLFSA